MADDDTADAGSATDGTGAAPPSSTGPGFDATQTGMRKRGDGTGTAALTAAIGDVVEVFWSVKNADLVQLFRDDAEVGGPDRATDGFCPLWLAGLEPGAYTFKLAGGVARADGPQWSKDSAVELTLTLNPALSITKYWADPEPDTDNKEHLPQDLQLASGTKVKLQFATAGAKQVQITATPDGGSPTDLDPVELDGDGNGSLIVDPSDQLTVYTAVALNGELKSEVSMPVTVHFHEEDDLVSPLGVVPGGVSAVLTALDAQGKAPEGGSLRLGAGDGLQLSWSAEGAKSARLTATSLVQKSATADPPTSVTHVSNDQLVATGIDLPLADDGTGNGVVVVDPGPQGSTEYSLTVLGVQDGATPTVAKATAYVANFNVQLKLTSNQPAANKSCILEIPNLDPVQGVTNEAGELWLWVPNTSANEARLRILDGDKDIAAWEFELALEPGVAEGTLAVAEQTAAAEGTSG